jgi:NitT/TauT family transport system permease protein
MMATTTTAKQIPTTPSRRYSELPSGFEALPTILSFVLLIAGWEALGRFWNQPFFPPLSAVLDKLVSLLSAGLIIDALGHSLVNLAIGFSIALVFGLLIGLAMGAFRRVNAALDIYVNALLTAPSLVFAPVFFAIWGLGPEPVIAIVVMYAIFIIIINTQAAVTTVPVSMIEMGRSFNASRLQMFRRIIIPSALPLILAGIRLGAGRAVKGMLNGEMFIAIVGLGRLVMDGSRSFDASLVLAIVIVVVLVAFAVVWAVQQIDNYLTRWLPKTAR